jgi:hypothetical protein
MEDFGFEETCWIETAVNPRFAGENCILCPVKVDRNI